MTVRSEQERRKRVARFLTLCVDSMTETEQDEYSQDSGDFDKDEVQSESNNVEEKPYEKTKCLVSDGEKSVLLALEVSKQKDELALLQQEAAAFRSTLLQGINGGVEDSKNYEHVSLEDLLRIRLQEGAPPSSAPTEDLSPQKSIKDDSSIGVIQRLEQKLAKEKEHNDELEARCIALKNEIAAATKQNEGVENLHIRISQMNERLRNEREQKTKLANELNEETKKVEALSDHIEKLMIHLKHEAISKARSLSDQSKLQRELDATNVRIEHLEKKNDRKDKAIADLRETGKLLEDQLRLMDEKYMDIRSKLDWTRTQTNKICKQKEQELHQLREKFALLEDKNDVSSSPCPVLSSLDFHLPLLTYNVVFLRRTKFWVISRGWL